MSKLSAIFGQKQQKAIALRVDRSKGIVKIAFGCGQEKTVTGAHGERHTQVMIENEIEAHTTKTTSCRGCAKSVADGLIVVERVTIVELHSDAKDEVLV